MSKYSIIDIETTGARNRQNKITEIAIINIDDGDVTDEFSSLINPQRSIPLHIQRLTGITDEMVRNAPKFYEIAKKIVLMTEDRVFVAHNVHFDYNFLQQEFRDLGFVFKRELLCTVRLSRKLLPGHKSYSLGRLCADLDIPISKVERHRALGDARATYKLFKILMNTLSHEDERKLKDRVNLPPFLAEDKFSQLPETCGVYYLWDKEGFLLYVGKAKNIKKRVRQHFTVTSSRLKEYQFKNSIANVTFKELGHELCALLFEASEIKKLKPLFNKAQKKVSFPYYIFLVENDDGFLSLQMKKSNPPHDDIIRCASKKTAESKIRKIYSDAFGISVEHHLDFDLKISSFRSLLAKNSFNSRIEKVFNTKIFKIDSFKIVLPGRIQQEVCHFCVEENILIMSFYQNNIQQEKIKFHLYEDMKNLLVSYISKHHLYDSKYLSLSSLIDGEHDLEVL